MVKKKLTPKEQRFVEEYPIDFNGTKAVIRAGYSAKSAASIASENLRKPHILEAISKVMERRSERTGVTADDVVRILWETMDRCRVAGPAHAKDVIKCCELLGRHVAMFTDNQDVNLKGEVSGTWTVKYVKPPKSK